MWYIIGILVGLNIWQIVRQIDKEAFYLGKNSSLRLQLADKEREVFSLKDEIRFLENPPDMY